MEAILTKASWWLYNEIEINKLEDIIEIMKNYNNDIILKFNRDGILELKIYDDYIE